MSANAATVLAAAFVAAGSIFVGWITVRQNRRGAAATNQLEERKVNRDDFDSITRELRAQIADIRSDLNQARADLDEEREMRETADRRASEAEERARRADERARVAEQRASRLERRVTQLETAMRGAGVEIPPPLAL